MGNIENHGNVTTQNVIHIEKMFGNIGASGGRTARMPDAMNLEYYNLFVVDDDTFRDAAYVVIPKESALTDSMTPEDKAQFSALHDEAIEHIKTFPSLFGSKNHGFAKTDDNHFAILGFVSDVIIRDNCIRVHYSHLPLLPIRQQRLNEIAPKLRIEAASSFNEFNRVHWSIKRLNLIEVLRAEGINLTAFA